jgi:hypothetical protein
MNKGVLLFLLLLEVPAGSLRETITPGGAGSNLELPATAPSGLLTEVSEQSNSGRWHYL